MNVIALMLEKEQIGGSTASQTNTETYRTKKDTLKHGQFLYSNPSEYQQINATVAKIRLSMPYGVIRILRHTREGAQLTDNERVEHQKRNQPAIEKSPFGFGCGVQLSLWQTKARIMTKKNNKTTFKFGSTK